MKPDWKDAPEWANWLAMDSDGEWFWFRDEPDLDDNSWQSYGADFDFAGNSRSPRTIAFEHTLEPRPSGIETPEEKEELDRIQERMNDESVHVTIPELRQKIRQDLVNKPAHYQLREGYEVYDLRQDLAAKAANGGATYDQYSDWDRAIEYQLRCWQKNGVEDLKKARWYLDKLIEKLEA